MVHKRPEWRTALPRKREAQATAEFEVMVEQLPSRSVALFAHEIMVLLVAIWQQKGRCLHMESDETDQEGCEQRELKLNLTALESKRYTGGRGQRGDLRCVIH